VECGDPSVTDGAELAGAFNKPHPQPGSDICREPASSLLAQTIGPWGDGLSDGVGESLSGANANGSAKRGRPESDYRIKRPSARRHCSGRVRKGIAMPRILPAPTSQSSYFRDERKRLRGPGWRIPYR